MRRSSSEQQTSEVVHFIQVLLYTRLSRPRRNVGFPLKPHGHHAAVEVVPFAAEWFSGANCLHLDPHERIAATINWGSYYAERR